MLQEDQAGRSPQKRHRRSVGDRLTKGIALVTTAVAALAVASCSTSSKSDDPSGGSGGAGNVTPLSLTLNYLPGGAQAGFMYGKSLGLYEKAGIDLKIIPGQGSLTTAQLIARGKVKVGYLDAATAMQVASKGGPLTVVAPILQANGYAVISLKKSGISSISKLKGKHVATVAGVAPTVLLPAVLKTGGLSKSDVHMSNITSSAQVGSLITHKFDAIIATGDVQSPQLRERGKKINTLWYYKNGVPTVGESIVVNSKFLKSHEDLVRRFVDASLRSWAATKKNPSAAADAEAKQFPAEGTAKQELDQIKVDIQLLCAADGATHMGKVPDAVWQETQDLLVKHGLLAKSADYNRYVTSDYLPDNPPKCS